MRCSACSRPAAGDRERPRAGYGSASCSCRAARRAAGSTGDTSPSASWSSTAPAAELGGGGRVRGARAALRPGRCSPAASGAVETGRGPGGEDIEGHRQGRDLVGRIVRRRRRCGLRSPSVPRPTVATPAPVAVREHAPDAAANKDDAIRLRSSAPTCWSRRPATRFVSLLDPPRPPRRPPPRCRQTRCYPVLVGARARPTWCWARRSSSTTTPRSPPRAPARSSTPPRSTRSSPCA